MTIKDMRELPSGAVWVNGIQGAKYGYEFEERRRTINDRLNRIRAEIAGDIDAWQKKHGYTLRTVEPQLEDFWGYDDVAILLSVGAGQVRLCQLPGCCGAAVASCFVGNIAALLELSELFARAMGYSLLMWTNTIGSTADDVKQENEKIKRAFKFVNKKTSREVFLDFKVL